ncbi:MAG: DUF6090 family protein [Saprospiraceae bacterium]
MIQIFRKIRLSLISEGNAGKYLKYAIGEIVLVVLGILIALQINNWNNNNQLQKLEKKYLNEIKNNLISDLPDLQFNIDFNETRLQSYEIVLKYVLKEIGEHDSLNFHFGNLFFTTRTLANTSGIENLKSKGLEIISNDSLRQNITFLYSFSYHNISDFELQDDHPFQYNLFMPEVNKAFRIHTIWKKAEPIDKQNIFNNDQFKNVLTTNIFIRKYMLKNYKALKKDVENCISQIDRELNK